MMGTQKARLSPLVNQYAKFTQSCIKSELSRNCHRVIQNTSGHTLFGPSILDLFWAFV